MSSEAVPSETKECISFVEWADTHGLNTIHIPNGMYRTEVSGRLLQLMGLRPGFPDYLILDSPPGTEYKGTALEMKKREDGDLRENQRKWLTLLGGLGWIATCAAGCREAVTLVSKIYGIPFAYPVSIDHIEFFGPNQPRGLS